MYPVGHCVKSTAIALLLLAIPALPAVADGQRPAWGASIALGSDYLFRGVSQTLGKPAVQASLDVELESGLYGYVWGSNVDFAPDGWTDDGADIEVDAAVGFATSLGERWALDTMLAYYRFPGTVPGIDYNYAELINTLIFDNRYAAAVAFSDDVFGSGENGLYFELGADFELSAGYSLAIDLGHYDLGDAWGASYSYAGLAIGRSLGMLSLTLDLVETFGDTAELFPSEASGARAVLTVGLGW